MKTVRLSSQDKLNLISSLGILLSSGIPILESTESLISESKGAPKIILETLKADLKEGKTIAHSFSRFKNAFDPVTVNLIKAAEEAGTLDTTLKDLSKSIKKDIAFANKVKGALVYPFVIVIVLLGVLTLNLFFVIPRVATVFTRLKVELPLPTKILIIISNFATSYVLYIIPAFAILVFLTFLLFRAKKQLFLNLLFSLPLVSKLGMEIDITRFSRSMHLLLSSGIPITEALDLSQNVVNKNEIKSAIKESQRLVTNGKNLTDGLKKFPKTIPSFMVRILGAGEKSGTLEKSMQELSEQFSERVSNRLKTLTTLIEPVLLLLVGILVGGLMLAIIAPIYQLIGQIKPR